MPWTPSATDIVNELLDEVANEPPPQHPENVLTIEEEVAEIFSALSHSGQLGDEGPEIEAIHECINF